MLPPFINVSTGPLPALDVLSGGDTVDGTPGTIPASDWPSLGLPVTEPEILEAGPQTDKPAIDVVLASRFRQAPQSVPTADKLSIRAADAVFANYDMAGTQQLQQALDDLPSEDARWVWATALAGLMSARISGRNTTREKRRVTMRP
jgi:hypothetical protein